MHAKFKQHKYNFDAEAVCIVEHKESALHIKADCSAEYSLRLGHEAKHVLALFHTFCQLCERGLGDFNIRKLPLFGNGSRHSFRVRFVLRRNAAVVGLFRLLGLNRKAAAVFNKHVFAYPIFNGVKRIGLAVADSF